MIIRNDGRGVEELREIKITPGIVKNALGSCIYSQGDTKLICAVSMEENVPSFLKGKGEGWLTAEYRLLPYSCGNRVYREKLSGRIYEIQRLIGRSLRACIDLKSLPDKTLWVDCDIIQADGGTRVSSINAGFVSLVYALDNLRKKGVISSLPLKNIIGAVSISIWKGNIILDPNYVEDSDAEADFNIVMDSEGNFIEIQGTAEQKKFSSQQLDEVFLLAKKSISKIIEIEKKVLSDILL